MSKLFKNPACEVVGLSHDCKCKVPLDVLSAIMEHCVVKKVRRRKILMFINSEQNKAEMMSKVGLKHTRFSEYIKRMQDYGMIISTGKKGVYVCNPWYLLFDSWRNVKRTREWFYYDDYAKVWHYNHIYLKF